MAKRELPPDYYLQHFAEFLQQVERLYSAMFGPEAQQFTVAYQQLPMDAKRLWLRMISRKGTVFALDDLGYQEISDFSAAVHALLEHGFASLPQTTEDWLSAIARLTKPRLWQLIDGLATTDLPPPSKQADRAQLQQWLAPHIESGLQVLRARLPMLALRQTEPLHYLLFLFFGHIETDLSAFTMRDLGIVPTGQFKTQFRPRYLDEQTAKTGYAYALLKQQWRALNGSRTERLQAFELQQWFEQSQLWPSPLDERSELIAELLCYEAGRQAERLQLSELAIAWYLKAPVYPATERLLRLYLTEQRADDFNQLLESMLQQPSCDEELSVAQEFAKRKAGEPFRLRRTVLLQQAPELVLDEIYSQHVEQGVISHLAQQGFQAWHVENELWLACFGLLFWHELFESDQAAIYNEFERRPRDLHTNFYLTQQAAIEQKLALLGQSDRYATVFLPLIQRFAQTPNAVFRWHSGLQQPLQLLVEHAPTLALASIMRAMARDFRSMSRGYPDLLVFQPQTRHLRLIEVKAPGDVVRRHQQVRLAWLQQLGFEAMLWKVRWGFEPSRCYAVVDVETTGGTSSQDRITEIAIVKLQQGQVISRYSQLVNPQRSIPPYITRLTGISADMVRAMPSFQAIAEQVAEQLRGCVFVAHNVRFDFNFVRAEFARCGMSFEAPTLCTVVQSRRYFPGLPSYGLAVLAEQLAIPLTQHHRALADAEATAEIFRRIWLKRAQAAGLTDVEPQMA